MFYFIMRIISCHFIFLKHKTKNYSNIAEAVDQVLNEFYVNSSSKINLLTSEKTKLELTDDFIDELLKQNFLNSKVTLIQERWEFLKQFENQRRQNCVFVIKSFKDFQNLQQQLTATKFKFNGYFLIVSIDGEIQEIKEIFSLLWKLQIFNVNAIFEDANGEILVKTFLPFSLGNCNNTKPILINRFKNGKFENGLENFFPNKMNNLHGCKIKVSTTNSSELVGKIKVLPNGEIKFSGRDMKLIYAISISLNFKINFTYIGPFGYFYSNGTSKGVLGTLLDSKADLTIAGTFLKANRLKFFDASIYHSEGFVFLIPQGREFTAFEKLIFPFDFAVWILVHIFFLVGFVVIIVIKRQKKVVQDFVFGENVKNPNLNFFIGFIGGSQTILPKYNFARFLLMMFLLYSLVLRTAYQGSYFKLMQSNKKHKEVQSIDEMIEKNFTLYTLMTNVDLLDGIEKIRGRIASVPSSSEENVLIEKIKSDPSFKGAYGKSLSLAATLKSAEILLCKETFATIPIVIYTKKDFYLLDAMNEKVENLKNSGLIIYWHQKTLRRKSHHRNQNEPKVISLKGSIGSFQLLLCEFILSFVVFVFELALHFYLFH
jgi:hypothetical protein